MNNYSNKDENYLIEQIVAGDSEALGALYDRYKSLVFSLAKNVTGSYEAAEGVTLDVFTQIWEKAGTYRREKAPVKHWITSITRYRAIDVLRWRKKRPDCRSCTWVSMADSLF